MLEPLLLMLAARDRPDRRRRPLPRLGHAAARASAAVLLALAACRGAEGPAEAFSASASVPLDPAQADATRTRARAAGLTEAQAAELERLGMPIYVPNLPAGWTLAEMTSDTAAFGKTFLPVAYTLRYTTPAGACLKVWTASAGRGNMFYRDPPPNERAVDVPGVPTAGPARLGWGAPGDTTAEWTDGRVATEWFGLDNLALRLDTVDGCPPPSLDDAEALLVSLRPLDPADDVILIGPVTEDEPVAAEWWAGRADPEEAVRLAFGSAEGGGATTVETLRRRRLHAVVLATTRDPADEAVRERRTWVRLMLDDGVTRPGDPTWHIEDYGSQWRCQSGHGHMDWGADLCS